MNTALGTVDGWTTLNTGGRVPGSGPDRDSVPAWLTPGEFVLNRKAAARIPPKLLAALNDPRYKLQGDVGLNAGGYVKSPKEVLDWARTQTRPVSLGRLRAPV